MNKTIKLASLMTAIFASATQADSSPSTTGIKEALKNSKVNISFRTRFEGVDQNGVGENASSLSLKSRLTTITGAYKGFSLGVEVDDVTAIIDDYNSTSNGKTQYPVVADPEGADINQAYLKFGQGKFTAIIGRQRILHNNQRFVGGVGWRQNEQTYDGVRVKLKASDSISLDYSYIQNVNRIFGPEGGKADLKGGFNLFNVSFKMNKGHTIKTFAYILDFDTAAALSTSTYGFLYNGKLGTININASYAAQKEHADNPNDFDTNYYNFEIGTKVGKVTLLGGYEVLGSDNGIGFTTPLATLHKFQGFNDKFLATPGNGIEDIYFTAKTKISNIKLAATYHDLSSSKNSVDYGSEIDLVAAYAFNKNYNILFKYASYDADNHASDTDKLWLQFMAKF
jgi:hypothetical protein